MMASSSAELEVRSSASDSSLSEWHLDTGSSARCWGTGDRQRTPWNGGLGPTREEKKG
jgi:hypothetical protein